MIMKKSNYGKMFSAALMMMAAMTMTSCSGSKKIYGGSNVGESSDMGKNEEDLDNSYLVLSEKQHDVINKNNEFALRLFDKISGQSSQIVSPMSVAYLMGMLANGADGNTQQEILKAIGCEGVSVDDLNETYKAILSTAGQLDKQTKVEIANFIAVNKNFSVKENFSKKVSDSYQAEIESLDFTSGKTTKHINGWCKEKTQGMIPQIIDRVDPQAVSYLMNAIFFNGTWQSKFDARNTKEENFRGYTRNIQKVQMMRQVKKFYYSENDTFKAIDLPYGNGTYRMMVLLPNEGKSIDDMMKGLNAEKVMNLGHDMEECLVNLKLPKFTIEQNLSLNGIISELGAPSIFNPAKADFSRFASGDFYVSKMLQKAKIEVSERGTKAAAVTAAIMLTSAAPMEVRHVDFHADHPFVYMIQDTQSGGILFMGQYCGTN